MKAMVLRQLGPVGPDADPLVLEEAPDPEPGPGQVLLEVSACGVCHTELDEIEGRTAPPVLPVILGHQVVGHIADRGTGADRFAPGERVGVGWIYAACGNCEFCRRGLENLCPDFKAAGRDANGGYAEKMIVPEAFAHRIPACFSDVHAAPLFCAGAIGYRSLRLAGLQNGQSLGLTGFGASAHLVLKMVKYRFPDSPVCVFARSPAERNFALTMGAAWAGDTAAAPPLALDAIIDTTPAWTPIVKALAALKPAGRLVVNAIRKESGDKAALMDMDYPAHLWLEKQIVSVANVARQDIAEFLLLAADAGLQPEVEIFGLRQANEALRQLKARRIKGAKVLVMD
jgi:propanol-preferring alcohol dehydrogenase